MMAIAMTAVPVTVGAQKVNPLAYFTDDDGNEQESQTVDNVQAPLHVEFRANPEGMEDYFPSYEWHFRHQKNGEEQQELFVRYEENTDYTFNDSGTFYVVLKYRLEQNGEEQDSTTITVIIPESRLEFPNAFSPNGDGKNDKYGAKGVNQPESTSHWTSIIDFHAYIFNRWGQKLYEWHDPAGYWDGKYKGNDVPDGVYYVVVNAKGADGRIYHIRKDVNLLRAINDGSTGGSNTEEE